MPACYSRTRIEEHLRRPAPAASQEPLEAHLESCRPCRDQFQALTEPREPELWRAAAVAIGCVPVAPDSGDALAPAPHANEQANWPSDADAYVQLGPYTAPSLPLVERKAPIHLPMPAIPGYEFLSELGRGGMGVVYKARQLAADRVVALKMIQAGYQATSEDLGRFHDEAEAIARLRHPHVVQILEVGEFDKRLYFVLEYVEGGTLAHKIMGRPVPPRSAAQLLEALARAMHYAHSRGIIHRDLKPANVLLHSRKAFVDFPDDDIHPTEWDFRRAMPKITDFGLAKLLDRAGSGHTASGDVVGTPSYMAPEQAHGRPYPIGPTTDVYALGAILYELLTGRPPFVGPTPMDTLYMVHRDEPVPPRRVVPAVPTDLEAICLRCLRKNPAQRYKSAEELAEHLRLFIQGEALPTRDLYPLWQKCLSFRRKTVGLPWAVAATAVALTAGTLLGLLLGTGR